MFDSIVNEIMNLVCGMKQRMDRTTEKMGELKDARGRAASQMAMTPQSPSFENVGGKLRSNYQR